MNTKSIAFFSSLLFVTTSAFAHDKDAKFKMMDTDNDGKISNQEYTDHMQEKFKKYDANNDGYLDKDEFNAMMADKMKKMEKMKKNDNKM